MHPIQPSLKKTPQKISLTPHLSLSLALSYAQYAPPRHPTAASASFKVREGAVVVAVQHPEAEDRALPGDTRGLVLRLRS